MSFTLVTTIGWGIILPATKSVSRIGIEIPLDWVFFGVIGGFVNAFALRWMEPSLSQRHLLYLVSAWAIPFACMLPVTALISLAWGFTWAISGLSTEIVLRRVRSSIE